MARVESGLKDDMARLQAEPTSGPGKREVIAGKRGRSKSNRRQPSPFYVVNIADGKVLVGIREVSLVRV